MIIKRVCARKIEDSRKEATIEVFVNYCCGASAPSGKSTGKYETKPYYRNIDFCLRFLNNWNEKIKIEKFDDLERVEGVICKKLKLKKAREFGGNALFAFESAILKALAWEEKKQLWQVINSKAKKFPRPVGNVIGGGLHTSSKLKPVFQEFLLIPREMSFSKNVQIMKGSYNDIQNRHKSKKVNDEGALVIGVNDEEALKILSEFSSNMNLDIGVDIAASSFYDRVYDYQGMERTREAQIEHIIFLMNKYNVFYVEDPMEEEDFSGFKEIRKKCGEAMIVGDDLSATHKDRLMKAIENRSIGAMIVKPNQNGSLLEVRDIVDMCKKHGIKTVMSHRSGETLDSALADYAFAFQCDFIKCGIATKWRENKLKRMEEIERQV